MSKTVMTHTREGDISICRYLGVLGNVIMLILPSGDCVRMTPTEFADLCAKANGLSEEAL